MPQFESEPTLSVKYYESGAYTYDELTLLSALPDASQIEVRWDVNTVYGGAGQSGTVYNVEDLNDTVQQAIKTLVLNTQYTIDANSDTVTIIPAAIEDQAIVTSVGTFYYPSTFTVSSSQFLEIRRATDITYRVVDFQPGSRLTSENLNLANSQVFNAIQELTEFGFGGQGGSITDVDLSNSSVTDLGDVTFNTGVTGLVQWNSGTQQMENSGSTSGLVPNNEGVSSTDGQVLLSSFVFGGPNSTPSFDWEWLTTAEVFTTKAATTSLASVLTTIDSDLVTVKNRTSDMSRPAVPGATYFDTDDVRLTLGDLIVDAGDVTIQGESVYDYISHTPYWINFSLGDTASDMTGSAVRRAGEAGDFTSQALTGTGVGDLDTSVGIWVAPRDMTIMVGLAGHVTTNETGTLPSPTVTRMQLTIKKQGSSVTTPGLAYSDGTIAFGQVTAIFDVSAGQSVVLEYSRVGSSNVDVGVENGHAYIREVR